MLLDFFTKVRDNKVPATIREYLDLLACVKANVVFGSVDEFYSLAKLCLVKDEAHFDRFDKAFGEFFDGIKSMEEVYGDIPEEWLRREAEKLLSPEEMEKIRSLGGFDELMETLKKRLAEQEKRHQGGSKWIGTGGTSPFGADGYNPEGVRIGQDRSRHRRAVKVWDKRTFKDYDPSREIGTRNIKMALRRLRQFARTGAVDELDLDGTISATAQNAGYLDIKMRAERRNSVKLLVLFDVGGSMDDYIQQTEDLFSAVHSEFKTLEYYYFHNCLYESVWKTNSRRGQERIMTWDLLNKFPSDYKLIFVGDATMGPYEITYQGGSVEHWNEEAGSVWMQRILGQFQDAVWLNPQPEETWGWHTSIQIMQKVMEGRMFPLTLDGLTDAMRRLT
ncbi:MAG: vWA domain-containing protein [Alphaproteobacteria bacterium]